MGVKGSYVDLVVPQNKTNAVTIIGETSPYINSISSSQTSAGTLVTISGVRLQKSTMSDMTAWYKEYSYTNWKNSSDGKTITYLNRQLPAGFYPIQLIDSVTGKSNVVSFEVTGKEDLYPKLDLMEPKIEGYTVSQNGVALPVSGQIDTTWCKKTNPTASGDGPFEFSWSDSIVSCSWFPASHTYNPRPWTYNVTVRAKNTSGLIAARDYKIIVPSNTTQPSITVLSPNGGETIEVGSNQFIRWNAKSIPQGQNFRVYLINDSVNCSLNRIGCQNNFLIGTTNSSEYLWDTTQKMFGPSTGPNSVAVSPGSNYKIKVISELDVYDLSDNYFTIKSADVPPPGSVQLDSTFRGPTTYEVASAACTSLGMRLPTWDEASNILNSQVSKSTSGSGNRIWTSGSAPLYYPGRYGVSYHGLNWNNFMDKNVLNNMASKGSSHYYQCVGIPTNTTTLSYYNYSVIIGDSIILPSNDTLKIVSIRDRSSIEVQVNNHDFNFVVGEPRGITNFNNGIINLYVGEVSTDLKKVVLFVESTKVGKVIPTTQTCTSHTYSAWGTCSDQGQQTRTVTTSIPNGCTGGVVPVISQSCTIETVFESFSQNFTGSVKSKEGGFTFDLGKTVSVSSIAVNWVHNRPTCKGKVEVSADNVNWSVKKDWTTLPATSVTGSFSLSKLGNIRYVKFGVTGCTTYDVTSMKVVGTSQVTNNNSSRAATVLNAIGGSFKKVINFFTK